MDADPFLDYIPQDNFNRREESLDDGKMVMKLGGELDMFVSPGIAARFHELAEDGTRDVVVELSDAQRGPYEEQRATLARGFHRGSPASRFRARNPSERSAPSRIPEPGARLRES